LKPKKIVDTYSVISSQFNISEEQVDEIVSYYWRQLRKMIENLEEPYITIDGFGTFAIKHRALACQIVKSNEVLKALNPKDYKRYGYYKSLKEEIEKLNAVDKKVGKECERKRLKLIERYGKLPGDMEKERKNP